MTLEGGAEASTTLHHGAKWPNKESGETWNMVGRVRKK
jgi:hypothetical protein